MEKKQQLRRANITEATLVAILALVEAYEYN